MNEQHHHHHYPPPYHHHRHRHPALLVRIKRGRYPWQWRTTIYRLNPNRKLRIMTDVVVGHTVTYTILYLDQNGAPMLTDTTADSTPTWSNLADASIDTVSVSADGSTEVVTAVGAGSDSISVSVTVGGAVFSAVDQLTISSVPQVLSAIALHAVVE